jgi:hypothetical protein
LEAAAGFSTITPTLTGTVSKTYDNTLAATLSAANYNLTGVVDGDTITLGNETTGTYDTVNAGTGKTVSVTGLTATASNGALTVYGYQVANSGNVSGAIGTINPYALAVTADAKSKTYGASNPALTYTFGTLQNGDTASVFSGALARAAGEDVGAYAINQGTVSAGNNYTLSYTGANLTINPYAPTIPLQTQVNTIPTQSQLDVLTTLLSTIGNINSSSLTQQLVEIRNIKLEYNNTETPDSVHSDKEREDES